MRGGAASGCTAGYATGDAAGYAAAGYAGYAACGRDDRCAGRAFRGAFGAGTTDDGAPATGGGSGRGRVAGRVPERGSRATGAAVRPALRPSVCVRLRLRIAYVTAPDSARFCPRRRVRAAPARR